MKQQLADETARHDRPLVDIKWHALDVGLVQQIGGGPAGGDARVDQRNQLRPLGADKARVEEGFERVDRQLEAFQHDERGFVDRVGRAVAVSQLGGVEPADGVAEEIADSQKGGEPLVVGVDCGRVSHGRRQEKMAGTAGHRECRSRSTAAHCAFMHS